MRVGIGIRSHLLILIIHIIRIHAEKRITSSSQNILRTALVKINKDDNEIESILNELYPEAIIYASYEIRDGCSKDLVKDLVNKKLVILHCLSLINL